MAANRAFHLQDQRWYQAAASVPGHRGKIERYLRVLIDWLARDPWPQDRRFGGPVLTPAAIERKLRVTVAGRDTSRVLDADELANQCRRLVMLGAPGSGKTWLAKRTTRRCAERALDALAAGGTVDEVEVPLYTTCSGLVSAGGDIREAAVSSALNHLGDLGGSRVSAALRVFFTERNAPTLLVIDSLDEAHGSDERLRQADTLAWRIVLTSRPNSWNDQLLIERGKDSHQVGELQPLRYPDDVEPFIARWFDHRPEWGSDLAAQIARRPGLQQAATVPLILALYCIVGGEKPLPDFRHDLYARVLNRLLTGRWRGVDDHQPDVDACLQLLRSWAWSAATSHPVSGVGTWADDIFAGRTPFRRSSEDRLDHVAAPLGPPDVDTGKTLRRFVHRSIREHLVAEHMAGLPVDQAAEELLPHLWYDPDWEYTAPAAIATHPQHDQLLRALICRAARQDQIPENLSIIDGGWEFRRLLARVASESDQADWSHEIAAMIGQARVQLVRSGRGGDDLGAAPSWGSSNDQIREALLGFLTRGAAHLVEQVLQLDPTAEGKRRSRQALFARLSHEASSEVAAQLANGMARLDPTEQDKRQARDALLKMLAADTTRAAGLVSGVIQLATTEDDKRQARDALLRMLADQADNLAATAFADGVAQLDPTEQDKRRARVALLRMLAGETTSGGAARLVNRLAQLDPTVTDKRRASDALLGLLARGASSSADLAVMTAQLATEANDKRKAREALLGLLARESDGRTAAAFASALAQLNPARKDKFRARQALLGLFAGMAHDRGAAALIGGFAQLDPTEKDKRHARDALLGRLDWARNEVAPDLARAVTELDPTAADRRRARDALLRLLARETNNYQASQLVGAVVQLATETSDKHQARQALLRLLARETYSLMAGDLAGGVIQLDPTEEEKHQARQGLLGMLADQADGSVASQLARGIAQLDPTAEDKRQAREVLLRLLLRTTYSQVAAELAGGVVQLATDVEDKQQARQALLGMLTGQADYRTAAELAAGVIQLDPTAEDKRQAREVLLGFDLVALAGNYYGAMMAYRVRQLDPTARDLSAWTAQPTAEQLTTARWNSTLADWLEALPSLTSLSDNA